MTNYAFILGRKNLLSTAELCSVLDKHDHIVDIQRETLIAGLHEKLQRPQESLRRLGGTIKIAEIFRELPFSQADISNAVSDYLIDVFKDRDSKVPYGLSVYNFSQRNEQIIKKVLMGAKKALKTEGVKSRFINKNFQNLKNAAIAGEKLLESGAEIIAIQGKKQIFLARTVALQDFESYSHRDYDRPARDPRLGMLPPKLAQIMINLSGFTKLSHLVPPDTTLYDPFAGIGTVLTEGVLMGYNVVGSDINQEALHKAGQNMEWVKQNFSTDSSCDIFQKDATALTSQDMPRDIHGIVTESFLGPPLRQLPDQKQILKNFRHIEETLLRFFRAAHPLLKPGTPVVISFPAYRDHHAFRTISALPGQISQLGYKTESLIPKEILVKFSLPSEESLIYDRPDQIVARQIWKFVRR